PVPHRGKVNEPGFVMHVAEYIAELKGVPLETVAQITTNNFFKLFNILR
ncbi:MAG TPA: TatD family hydrolase, partial [Burkholderiaceae bacterium]